jgi:predicted PhzF superfamily epimerase YddE/YHI9
LEIAQWQCEKQSLCQCISSFENTSRIESLEVKQRNEMTRVFLVDAFTAQAFAGNPAAVFLLDGSPSDEWLLSMTREFGCEAAFLSSKPQQTNFGLRFFTSSGEDLFCGHGTLSSAHVLYEQGLVADDARIAFDTVSGPFSARRITTGIELDLPAEIALPMPPPAELLNGLGQTDYTVRFVGKNRMDYLVRLESEREVWALRPNFEVLKQVDCRGVIVTAQANPNQSYSVVSRFFAPAGGALEDHATGSAHCALAPYWTEQLGINPILAHQASPRGAALEMEMAQSRVLLRGQAVTVMQGTCRTV